jgi:hypothetical protein
MYTNSTGLQTDFRKRTANKHPNTIDYYTNENGLPPLSICNTKSGRSLAALYGTNDPKGTAPPVGLDKLLWQL